jgi:UDP-3-O-[3-hydroxymyristoyl] N-acetylglucosamine deacetylase/3-hydroxyacyl-[acyl-carrier-protein] dehydratase
MKVIRLPFRQRTLCAPISFEGAGLHTGELATMTVRPAPDNSGRRFIRADLAGAPEIPTLADNVVECERGVTLSALVAGKAADARVRTVEHILSALAGMGVDNCAIELSASEPPALDGSAQEFVRALARVGFVEQQAYRSCLALSETITVEDSARKASVSAAPSDDFRVLARVEYDGFEEIRQQAQLDDMRLYAEEIAPARTFCLFSELASLRDLGLIRGGTRDNAVVFFDREPLSGDEARKMAEILGIAPEEFLTKQGGFLFGEPLRFPNEAARHKILDIIGDLSLAGISLRASICATRPGHCLNVELARKIQRLRERAVHWRDP